MQPNISKQFVMYLATDPAEKRRKNTTSGFHTENFFAGEKLAAVGAV